jgi:ABC-type spermidine/putrescine transport system permease subunit II
MWVQAIRAFPIAVVFLWPIVRMIPREVAEEARLAGARAVSVWLGVVIPLTWRATAVVALASAALCLGEVAASTRVETPGWESFTKLIFDRMHFGVDNNVSALCVLMLASPVAIGCVVFGLMMLLQLGRRER